MAANVFAPHLGNSQTYHILKRILYLDLLLMQLFASDDLGGRHFCDAFFFLGDLRVNGHSGL